MKAKIEITMDNAAFGEAPATELGRILRELADNIEAGRDVDHVRLRDYNGNTVGYFDITD